MLFARRSVPPTAGDGRNPSMRTMRGPRLERQVQPVNAFLEERVASGHRFVVAPVVGRLELPDERREVPEHHLADGASLQQLAKTHGERLVVIVLADEDDLARPRLRRQQPSRSPQAAGTPASRRGRAFRRRALAASAPDESAAAPPRPRRPRSGRPSPLRSSRSSADRCS